MASYKNARQKDKDKKTYVHLKSRFNENILQWFNEPSKFLVSKDVVFRNKTVTHRSTRSKNSGKEISIWSRPEPLLVNVILITSDLETIVHV